MICRVAGVLQIRAARPLMVDMEIERLLDMAAVTRLAIRAVEESGIVFIDEVDKVSRLGNGRVSPWIDPGAG